MQKQKENLFSDKFRLLNSQEHVADINWSASDSSDFENISNSERFANANKVGTRKRKRKKKVPKNISNLDITIVDVSKDLKEADKGRKSPVLQRNKSKIKIEKSPVFAPSPIFFPAKSIKVEPTSPILTCRVLEQSKASIPEKSPIFHLKYSSPKASPRVKKELFKEENDKKVTSRENDENSHLDRRKSEIDSEVMFESKCFNKNNNLIIKDVDSLREVYPKTNEITNKTVTIDENDEIGITLEQDFNEKTAANTEDASDKSIFNLDDSDSFSMLKTTNPELIKRVKSYFDNHFSSETTSQHSISNSLTPKHNSKSSEGFDIISIGTQVNSKVSSQSEKEISKNASPISSQSAEMDTEKSKKIRYKKDGLSYRLSALLKKQNANISLWQHERFLAENSNFVIPRGDHLVFRIRKVIFKYGCYLLEAIDLDNCNFLIPILAFYVQDINLIEGTVFKLYEPYKIIDFNEDFKLIINVCKFECVNFKK